jgi:thiol-disulfide isomerase/thioredoxin
VVQSIAATPFEEREVEGQKSDDKDDDWTPVKGGFLPRIRRRFSASGPVTEVSNLIDYKREVVDCEEKVVVVKFYSSFCRTCKAMSPLYKKIANQYSDNPSVKFVQVPVTAENAVLHQGLGVPSVPFGHIYVKGAGLVEELKLKKQDFAHFQKTLESYVEGSCNTGLTP